MASRVADGALCASGRCVPGARRVCAAPALSRATWVSTRWGGRATRAQERGRVRAGEGEGAADAASTPVVKKTYEPVLGDKVVARVVRTGYRGCTVEIVTAEEGTLHGTGVMGFVPRAMYPRDIGHQFDQLTDYARADHERAQKIREEVRSSQKDGAEGEEEAEAEAEAWAERKPSRRDGPGTQRDGKRGSGSPGQRPFEALERARADDVAPLGLVREFVVRSLADPERHKVSCVLSGRQVDRDLMFRRADQIAAVCKSDKELLRGTVISTNENGYVVRTAGFLVFVPRKLADLPPDADLEEVHPRDSSVELSVIRVDLQRSRIVGSFSDVPIHKSYQKVKVGSLVSGKVRQVLSYGVFVSIDGTRISGLLHISNVSNKFVPSIDSIFKEGDRVKAIVVGVEPGFRDVALSTAELEAFPGQMLEDKDGVMEGAKEQAKEFQQFLDSYVQEGDDDAGDDNHGDGGRGRREGAEGGRDAALI